MGFDEVEPVETWRTTHGDLTDEEWELIAEFFPTWSAPGTLGRPAKHAKRDIVNAILYVSATGCQWRALPSDYPNWNTVHRYHLQWSRDGTWEAVAAHLAGLVRQSEGREVDPSAGVVDARTVRGAATVTSATRGYDAGKKISGRKTFGVVDTLGLLIAVGVFAASISDNAGGIEVMTKAVRRTGRLSKVWCDRGFKVAFAWACRKLGITAEVVERTTKGKFVALPRRWVVERTWSWLMNNRRLQIDYERDPIVHEGFIWAAHSRQLLRRLTVN
jgi:transposase